MCCRTWQPTLHLPATPTKLAAWMLLMLQWVATYFQKCSMLQRNSMEVAAAAAAFAVCIKEMLPEKAVLSDVLLHMLGSVCAERMQACSKSVAGRGDLATPEHCTVDAKYTYPCFLTTTACLSRCAVYPNVCDVSNLPLYLYCMSGNFCMHVCSVITCN